LKTLCPVVGVSHRPTKPDHKNKNCPVVGVSPYLAQGCFFVRVSLRLCLSYCHYSLKFSSINPSLRKNPFHYYTSNLQASSFKQQHKRMLALNVGQNIIYSVYDKVCYSTFLYFKFIFLNQKIINLFFCTV
jgi:hypothetical protein